MISLGGLVSRFANGATDSGTRGGSAMDRREVREAVRISATLAVDEASFGCSIISLSAHGMRIQAPGASAGIGQMVAIVTTGRDVLPAVVRWIDGGDLGLEFPGGLSIELLRRLRSSSERQMQPRCGRARVAMDAVARHGLRERNITIANIAAGGLMFRDGMGYRPGQELIIDTGIVAPFAGHVRWSMKGRTGFMFGNFMAPDDAQIIARRHGLSHLWVEEVRSQHELTVIAH